MKKVYFILVFVAVLLFIGCNKSDTLYNLPIQQDSHMEQEVTPLGTLESVVKDENSDIDVDKPIQKNIIKEQFIEYIKNNNQDADVEVLDSIILDSVIVYGGEEIVNPPKEDERYKTYYLYYEDGKIFLDDVILITGPITDDDNPITFVNEIEEKLEYEYDENSMFYIFLQSKYGDYHYGIPLTSVNDYILSHGGDNLFHIYIEHGNIISVFNRNVP